MSNDSYLTWNSQSGVSSTSAMLRSLDATNISLGTNSGVNGTADVYTLYSFGHDTGVDGYLQCGSYTGTSGTLAVALGWKPQFLLVKIRSFTGSWIYGYSLKGIVPAPTPTDQLSYLDAAGATFNADYIDFTSTGFEVKGILNTSTRVYDYMAIREAA